MSFREVPDLDDDFPATFVQLWELVQDLSSALSGSGEVKLVGYAFSLNAGGDLIATSPAGTVTVVALA